MSACIGGKPAMNVLCRAEFSSYMQSEPGKSQTCSFFCIFMDLPVLTCADSCKVFVIINLGKQKSLHLLPPSFCNHSGQVAQSVERSPEKAGVGGSIPSLATI
jgi:hypothetical protein